MKKDELKNAKVPASELPAIIHLNRQIPPEPHTAMYVWHKYWSRKTWNVVSEFIKTYSREQEIIFDPFAGSGVTAIEAVRNKRRVIACDLNPVASHITELTLRPVNLAKLLEAFEGVRKAAQKKIEKLYEVHCHKCGKPFPAHGFVREGDKVVEVRYPGCPHCGNRCETGCKILTLDEENLLFQEKKKIKEWYPRQQLYYDDGTPFMKKERYDSLDQLFTKRNLQAAAWLHEAIQEEKSPQLRKFLMGAFTSMIHLCTRMCPALEPGEGNHQTAFSSTWTQHSYWSAPRYLEQNVWEKFESAMIGHQGLMKAKEESNRLLDGVKLTEDWREVIDGSADAAVITGDSLELMQKLPEECADYIFTDPPYDAAIQYGELSFLWNAWLQKDTRYTENLETHEIIRNERQQKSFDTYHGLIRQSFEGMFRVLRPGKYLTLTFHSPAFKVRNATVRAGVFAGFDYQKIHHQPLGQVSAKSMLQPFGSAQGDFYLRFQKPIQRTARQMEEVSEDRFRRIVVETCKEVIAERAEPTPYTILINYVDPKLAKMGLFGTLQTGLDVKAVLQESIGSEFTLVPAKLGGATGELWWFNDPAFVARLKEVPLTERVEETVFRRLHQHGRVTFTEMWDAVSQEFPNSLTSDSTSIREVLELYGRQAGKGYWILKDEIRMRLDLHSEMVALLAMIGREKGFDIWIAANEQAKRAGGYAGDVKLSELATVRKPTKIPGVTNVKTVLDMDLLWLKKGEVVRAFEVECTTTMTSALQRGSNLPQQIPKIMVLPEERHADFERKMLSPLFSRHYETESWKRLYFDSFREQFSRTKAKTDLDSLLDKLKVKGKRKTYPNHSSQTQILMEMPD
jgi:16S rRNA G966 N2-methylase RsmD